MNLGDPQWELIDPTPNVHALFVQFDSKFFWGKLAGVIVRWSKRMYSCAGICRYEGRAGMCDIALSEPLLKLRPRKDLVETLLHEMIHAYLFVATRDRDRDGHGPNFQQHMHRINAQANLHISVYHTFHDEVAIYQTHWWRCSGPCQTRKPFFGIVRRSANRAPGPNDTWWARHAATCSGTFVKIKEPEKKSKPTAKKPNEAITKYIGKPNENIKSIQDIPSGSKPSNAFTKRNGGNTVVITKKDASGTTVGKNIKLPNQVTLTNLWSGKENKLNTNALKPTADETVAQTVRNHWASKTFVTNTSTASPPYAKKRSSAGTHTELGSPPVKIKKIDTFFPKVCQSPERISKEKAESILKDIYGEDLTLHLDDQHHKPAATSSKNTPTVESITIGTTELVACPLCSDRVESSTINEHLDICLSVKSEPDEGSAAILDRMCPVCQKLTSIPLEEHFEDCVSFFDSDVPVEGASTTSLRPPEACISLLDSDEDVDESDSLNRTGTAHPCPCCLQMVEADEMNAHLDTCLQ